MSKGNTMRDELFEEGLRTRREVLGDAYVQKSLESADDFSMPMQEMVTRNCWGEVWNRPGLERTERSMINLAMISALNRPHELKVHVRGAIRNGLTRDQIQEVFLQVAIYAGAPAALESFRLAREVFAEMAAEAQVDVVTAQ
jgi:4-carboxymuconolactone decarboxylase